MHKDFGKSYLEWVLNSELFMTWNMLMPDGYEILMTKQYAASEINKLTI